MSYKYSITGDTCSISGSNLDYNWILNERDVILKTLFSKFVLSEKLNDLVDSPDYLVYEFENKKIYFKIEKEDGTSK